MIKTMVTIIIPTYNEAKNIKKIEKVLQNINGDFEVIFSDGFSTDGTFELINYPKIQESKHRSNQMNAAVNYANGDYLFFLHCDSIIGSECVNIIENIKLDCGAFKISFFPNNWKMRLIAYFSNLRLKNRRIAFGDQGIFIKKDIFMKIGGYKAIPIMEDYQLSLDLKEMGYEIKQVDYNIKSSARKFQKHAFLTAYRMKKLQRLYRKGYSINKISEIYKKI